MSLYAYLAVLQKQSRVNHFWNLTPKTMQDSLRGAWKYSPIAVKSLLSLTWKSIPNLPELVTGAAISSAVKVVFMGPLEKGFGDDPSLFNIIRNIVAIYTVHCHIQAGNEIGGSGVKYNNLHMIAAVTTSAIKIVMIGSEVYLNGVSEGSLTNTATIANYVSEPPARALWIVAQKQHDLKQDNEPIVKFISSEAGATWFLEAIVGSTCRMYVATEWGRAVSGYLGLNAPMREFGNNAELISISFMRENKIVFNNTDDIYIKYAEIIKTRSSDEEIITYPIIFTAIAMVDFTVRVIPEIVLGLLIVPPTRVTSAIFENNIGYVMGSTKAEEPTILEYGFEVAVLSTIAGGLMNIYLAPESSM